MDANLFTVRILRAAVLLLATVALSGCETLSSIGDTAAKPLEYIGLIQSSADDAKSAAEDAQAKAESAKAEKAARQRALIKNVKISLFAGPNLNATAGGQGLALVTRIYTLRDGSAIGAAPFSTFLGNSQNAEPFASDVVTKRELVLTPGQRIDTVQDIGADVNAVAVVALFRNPDSLRWRLVFDLNDAAKDGIVVGANACALSVTSGLSGTDAAGRSLQLLPPQCPK